MAFKMKGNPMQRNFGIGAPLKQGKDPEEKQYSKKQTLKEASKVSESKEATADPKVGAKLAKQKEGESWYDPKNPYTSLIKNPKKMAEAFWRSLGFMGGLSTQEDVEELMKK